ncbi:MAG: hypothetical protein AB1600_00960 [Bacteroidota bacterium]
MKIIVPALTFLTLLSLSACNNDSNPIQGDNYSLKNKSYKVQSIKFDYDGQKNDPFGWKTFIINSGIISLIGEIQISFHDSTYEVAGVIDSSYAAYFPRGLQGSCSGKFNIKDQFLTLNVLSWSPDKMFLSSSQGLSNIVATYSLQGAEIVIKLVVPIYMRYSPVVLGHEYYTITLRQV